MDRPIKLAVLSGKGGTGKTFVAVNMAASVGDCTYVDCDVEEPNGHLYLKPKDPKETIVYSLVPKFDAKKCDGCRKCVDFCRFNALALVKDVPIVFSDVCHNCGGCTIVCPTGAVSETEHSVGKVLDGKHNDVYCITGIMNLHEISGMPIISDAIKVAEEKNKTMIIDCPPGSDCSVTECVSQSDFCILVAEPTAFGLHNMKMVYELTQVLGKKAAVVINKAIDDNSIIEDYCKNENIDIISKIMYTDELSQWGAIGEIAVEKDDKIKKLFLGIYEKAIQGVEA